MNTFESPVVHIGPALTPAPSLDDPLGVPWTPAFDWPMQCEVEVVNRLEDSFDLAGILPIGHASPPRYAYSGVTDVRVTLRMEYNVRHDREANAEAGDYLRQLEYYRALMIGHGYNLLPIKSPEIKRSLVDRKWDAVLEQVCRYREEALSGTMGAMVARGYPFGRTIQYHLPRIVLENADVDMDTWSDPFVIKYRASVVYRCIYTLEEPDTSATYTEGRGAPSIDYIEEVQE